jgi:CubicO group peptidase (beta-lactamase class C family)
MDLQLSQRTGGFNLRKVEESSATKIVAVVQERSSDTFAQITLEVAPDPPHNIVHFQGQPIPRPAEFDVPHLTEQQLIAELRKKLEAESFSGAVLVAKNGQPILAAAYGLADREKNTPNTLATRFNDGSMNKMFTAVAILQLAQAGKIDLTAPIGKYLPDYPNSDVASKVTVRHLLTHTGGTGDFFGPEFQKHRDEMRTLDDYIKLLGTRGLAFEPGAKWEYSNYGFLLLGVIVERVSGQSYYDYVREHIYKPAGMSATASEPRNAPVAPQAIGYTKAGPNGPPSESHPNTDMLPYRGTSAGGGYSTVEDLLKFAMALQEYKLLNAKYTEMATTAQVQTPMDSGYGYGFTVRNFNGISCYGHNGGGFGINGELEICPSNGYVVAVLANADPPAAERVANFAIDRLPNK